MFVAGSIREKLRKREVEEGRLGLGLSGGVVLVKVRVREGCWWWFPVVVVEVTDRVMGGCSVFVRDLVRGVKRSGLFNREDIVS